MENTGLCLGLKLGCADDAGSCASPGGITGGVRYRGKEACFGGVVIRALPSP